MAISGVTTFLWFDTEALEAATFYVSLFPEARVTNVTHYGPGHPLPEGTVLTVGFELFGQPFVALNGGPLFPHSEAVSFMVQCDTQEEIDRLWDALISGGGSTSACGWCKDRWGVSWQVTPRLLMDLMNGDDREAYARAFAAMLTMTKLDVAVLEAAARG